MENDNKVENGKAGDSGLSFLVFRILLVALLLGLIMLFRCFMPDLFNSAEKAYDNSFGVDVTASYYLGAEDA